MKITTTQETIDEIKKVLEAQSDRPSNVRVFVAGHGCSGPSLGIALDDIDAEKDMVDNAFGVTFMMDKEVYEQLGDIKVEFMGNGYLVTPVNQAPSGCSGCGGGCGH